MKKMIGLTLLSAVAMLAAPKAQNTTTAPATTAKTTTVKKMHKKHHVKKAKTVKAVTANPSK